MTCILYKNHLSKTPKLYITKGTRKYSIECINGLGEMLRYDKSKYIVTKSVYNVPNIIVVYNKYMTGEHMETAT